MSVPENGNATPEPQPPSPGTIRVGQSLQGGRLWVAVQLETAYAHLIITLPPSEADSIGDALKELAAADQVVIQRDEKRIIRP